MDRNDIKEVLDEQRRYFQSGESRSVDFRLWQLGKLKVAVEKYEKEIIAALNDDLGKSDLESYTTEIGFVIAEINFMLKNLRRFAKAQKVKTPLLYWGGKSYIYSDPLGLALIIGPWNYPFQLMIAPLIGAIAGGNCAVLKPSEYAPQSSAVIKKIISENFPEEYIAVIEGGAEESTALLQERFDHIFFTGGPMVGRIVMQAAARNLTPVTLELGGKSPCIVDSNVNIKYVAQRIAWGKFLNAGQTCVAPDYLLLDKKIKDELLQELKQAVNDFYGFDPQISKDYSRIINERHFFRLSNLLGQGNVICGGQTDQEQRYIAPTIITDIGPDDMIMQEEIFGPILPVLEYEKLDEVIEFVNSRPKALALYFFSQDRRQQKRILKETSSGGVCINDTLIHITSHHLPFGGAGESGMGNYHGKASFDSFVHKKSVLKNTLSYDLRLKYPPYTISLERMKKILKKLM